MTPLINLKKQLFFILEKLANDYKNGYLVYYYYIIEKEDTFLNLDKLDFHFTKYKHNINFEKVIPLIRVAHALIYYWNLEFTNDMILKADKSFVYEKKDGSHDVNMLNAFRVVVTETKNREVIDVFNWGITNTSKDTEDEIKKMLDDTDWAPMVTVHHIACKCVELIKLIKLEYPEKDNDYEKIGAISYNPETRLFEIANKPNEVKDNIRPGKSEIFLKDLFRNPNEDYDRVISSLIENGFIEDNNGVLTWIGCLSEASLKPLKLLAVFGFVLKEKRYFNSSVNKKQISEALTNTFEEFDISEQYYGKTEKSIVNRNPNSKDADYYNTLHFIQCL